MTSTTSNHQLAQIGLILGLLSIVGPMSIDMYLPALPAMAEGLNTSIGAVQGTLAAYLIGFGIAQLFYGPVSDQIGRRAPLYIGLSLFIVGSALSFLAPSIEVLLAARVLQGLGGAVVMVIPRAIIRDIDTGVAATRLMGTIMMVISVSPMVAPLIGSGVMELGSWRTIFLALALLGFISLALTRMALPETLQQENRTPFNIGTFWSGVRTLLSDPAYLGLTFIGAFGMASFFVFFASASFVYTGQFGLTPLQFSLAFAVNGLGFFLATRSVGKVAERMGLPVMIKTAITGFAITMLALAAVTVAGLSNLPVLMAFLFVGFGLLGFIVPPTMVMALEKHGQIAGLASSLGGTLQVVTAGAMIAVAEPFFDGTAQPMVAVIALCASLVFILSRFTLRSAAVEQPA